MAIPRSGKDVITAALALRTVYGQCATKKIARAFGVSLDTAKVWLTGRLPQARRQEIAAVLLAECDRIERELSAIRLTWGSDVTHDQNTGASTRKASAHRVGQDAAMGTEAERVRAKVKKVSKT